MSWRDDMTMLQWIFFLVIGAPNVFVIYADEYTWTSWSVELPFWSYVAWYPTYLLILVSPSAYVLNLWWRKRVTGRVMGIALSMQIFLLIAHAVLAFHFFGMLDVMWEDA